MKFPKNNVIFYALIILIVSVNIQAKIQKPIMSDIKDLKELKKLLKARTNILILLVNEPKSSENIINVFSNVKDIMKGKATMIMLDCTKNDVKKLCKKLKVDTEKPYCMKHFKDGEYHKDYDRGENANSIANFLRDPTGEMPWEEDPKATDIFHLQNGEAIRKFLTKGPAAFKRSMIMFYAPWCGYCKILKPEYAAAAADLKGEALLAAIDVSKHGNINVRQEYNITGFPTTIFFERGKYRFHYNGDNNKQAIVEFMRDPVLYLQKQKDKKEDETWSSNNVTHLTLETFDIVIKNAEHALVVFYAPWCGHCKRLKPEIEKAASALRKQGIKGVLAAVDATKEPDLAAKFKVKGYPTLKYFIKGEFKFDASHVRQEEDIVKFMKEPSEPPAPPPPETPWSEEESHVRHLNATSFRTVLRRVKHVLVMFYAPWCQHCKNAKPEFVKAAEEFAYEMMVVFAAVDCTTEKEICTQNNVTGYPTIKYFSYYDKLIKDYSGGRKAFNFASFIHSQMGTLQDSEKAPKSNQEAGFGPNVLLLTDDNFENTISAASPTFVMFYATWCGHCFTVKPAFSSLATKLKSGNSPIKAVAVEASENPKVADFAGIQNLPTLKLFASGKLVADYDGDRSAEDMMNFVSKFSSQAKEEL